MKRRSLVVDEPQVRYIPKISKVIDPFLRRTLFKPFVFPNCVPVSISNREVKNLREAGKLLRYGQRARNVEGSLAVRCVREMLLDAIRSLLQSHP